MARRRPRWLIQTLRELEAESDREWAALRRRKRGPRLPVGPPRTPPERQRPPTNNRPDPVLDERDAPTLRRVGPPS
jgi:hypothetical protein